MHRVFVTAKGQGAMGKSRNAAATTGSAPCMSTGPKPLFSIAGADTTSAPAMASNVATESRSFVSDGS